jgi:hypothetical protein
VVSDLKCGFIRRHGDVRECHDACRVQVATRGGLLTSAYYLILRMATAITYTPSSDRLDARDVFEALSVTHKGIFNMERYVKPCQVMSSHCVQIANSLALVQIVEVNVDSFPKVIWA